MEAKRVGESYVIQKHVSGVIYKIVNPLLISFVTSFFSFFNKITGMYVAPIILLKVLQNKKKATAWNGGCQYHSKQLAAL